VRFAVLRGRQSFFTLRHAPCFGVDHRKLETRASGNKTKQGGITTRKFRYWASVVLTEYGRALEVQPGRLSFVTRSPIGVAGIIAPFNSPLVLTVRSLAPALAAGVTTVIKLPGITAQTNYLFSQTLT
jgi:betaine-aldehyde dehydrogenase